jgi:hypothetical protein
MDKKEYIKYSVKNSEKFLFDLYLLMLRFKSEVIDLNPSAPIDEFGFGYFLAAVSNGDMDMSFFFAIDAIAKELGIDPKKTGLEKKIDDIKDELE